MTQKRREGGGRDAASLAAWLGQEDLRHRLESDDFSEWTTVHSDQDGDEQSLGVFCAVVYNEVVAKVLSSTSWEIHPGDGRPSVFHRGGSDSVAYSRFGEEVGIEPFLFVRSFPTVGRKVIEISEEFRHFHDLCEMDGRLVEFDDEHGEPLSVVELTPEVRVRVRHLREFLAWKGAHLAVYVDSRRFATRGQPPEDVSADYFGDSYVYGLRIGPCKIGPDRTISFLMGKMLVKPMLRESTRQWPFREETRQFEEFVVGVDANGEPVWHSCDPSRVAGQPGANADAADFLTRLAFGRAVLSKYLDNPRKYTVQAGSILRRGRWMLRLDTDHIDRVVVYLGDIGSIPREEQAYWRSHQLREPARLSESAFRRDMLAQFAEDRHPEAQFRQLLKEVSSSWTAAFGWSLFREHDQSDAHVLRSFRVPVSGEQKEFDEQVQALAKILVDALNERALSTNIKQVLPQNTKGIRKLEVFADENFLTEVRQKCAVLRDIQELRSRGAAHLKGSDYPKTLAKFCAEESGLVDGFLSLLNGAIDFLGAIRSASASAAGKVVVSSEANDAE